MARKNPRLMRKARHQRVRKGVRGTAERPRLAVFRSLQHIYAQVVDDDRGHTLVAASSADAGIAGEEKQTKSAVADKVGTALAQKAAEAGIKQVVFDRGGFQYHGRVRALADGARKAGLDF
jgi:large subunit ribosomal protein L18